MRRVDIQISDEELTFGAALHEIVCDDAGRPVDHRFLDVNPAFERLTGLVAESLGESERILTQIETIANIGHWTWDLRNNTVVLSDGMLRILGVARESVDSSPERFIDRFIHPEDMEKARGMKEAILSGLRKLGPLDLRVVRPDGTIRTVVGESGEPPFEAQCPLTSLFGIVRDITDQKNVEQALRESEARVQNIFNMAAAGTGGQGTILLVEDEILVRDLARDILSREGYRVIEAGNGDEALTLLRQVPASIDLLLTDVVMPQMGGRELAERFQAIRPEIRVLFMSGYTDDAIAQKKIDGGMDFIRKPFSPAELIRKVREALGSESAGPSSGFMRPWPE